MPESPNVIYQQRRQDALAARSAAQRRWSLLGNLRLAIAVATLVAGWQAWASREGIWAIATAAGIVAFLALAIWQRTFRMRRDAADASALVNERAINRLGLAWDSIPLPPDAGIDRTHPYAFDLNVVGWGSLAQRIGTPVTHHGWQALYRSLLEEAASSDLSSRQQAIVALARRLDQRQRVESAGVANESLPDASPLLAWAVQDPWLVQRRWLRLLSIIGPILVAIAILLTVLGIVPWIVILLPVTLNTLVFLGAGSPAATQVQQVVPMRDAIATYGAIVAEIAHQPAEASLLATSQSRLSGAASALQVLSRTVNFAIPPGSMLYFPLQMLTMWDIHVLERLENWRHHHGRDLAGWLQAMGEWEALAALSVLAHDHPDWATPTIDDGATGFDARRLAHPLLTTDIAVANDVRIAPAGALLFVTGSNMSGKSTLLRAIGVNAVLAQAGAPVFATALNMPPVRISSCMRVEDSLAHGVSFFMAELQRLKAVVDRVQAGGDLM